MLRLLAAINFAVVSIQAGITVYAHYREVRHKHPPLRHEPRGVPNDLVRHLKKIPEETISSMVDKAIAYNDSPTAMRPIVAIYPQNPPNMRYCISKDTHTFVSLE